METDSPLCPLLSPKTEKDFLYFDSSTFYKLSIKTNIVDSPLQNEY